jgi:hypothetical protein
VGRDLEAPGPDRSPAVFDAAARILQDAENADGGRNDPSSIFKVVEDAT